MSFIYENRVNLVYALRPTVADKQTHRKRDEIYGYRRMGWEERELDEGSQKVHPSSYKMNK